MVTPPDERPTVRVRATPVSRRPPAPHDARRENATTTVHTKTVDPPLLDTRRRELSIGFERHRRARAGRSPSWLRRKARAAYDVVALAASMLLYALIVLGTMALIVVACAAFLFATVYVTALAWRLGAGA